MSEMPLHSHRAATLILGALLLTQSEALPPIERFVEAASPDERTAEAALRIIAERWKDGYAAMLIDVARLMRGPRRAGGDPDETLSLAALDDERDATAVRPRSDFTPPADPGSPVRRRLLRFLARQTGRAFSDDLNQWRAWMWTLPPDFHPDYAVFKSVVYGQIDPRMGAFFPRGVRATIRLDEIDWGGVPVNGIPPLRYPAMMPAAAASYLKDSNVVFGVVVNGEARAYPKRILAWHEMAIDRIGGIAMTIVYCTLCGTVIPFRSDAGGRTFRFGTSGLLYRSNKLMFDEETNSLWSTFEGVPVVGPLVGSGVALESLAVVTTTWKEWRTEHPETTVLSIETGFKRDYAEGAAYRDYFATDRLMFRVSRTDTRLANKAEVLVMRLGGGTAPVPVAIDVRLLRKQPVYAFSTSGLTFVVITTEQGANRVYQTKSVFRARREGAAIIDAEGRTWRITESALALSTDPSVALPRVSAQRAFWFGWCAQYPQTLLFK